MRTPLRPDRRGATGSRRGPARFAAAAAAALLVVLSAAPLLGSTAVAAVTVPPSPADFYLDQPGVLSEETKSLIDVAGNLLEEKTGAQIVVAVVHSLGGETVEDYANAMFRAWGIGDAQKDNGILLLVALDDRQDRIEVGYGLEGALNDAKAGRIRDTYLTPNFKAGDYDAGVRNAYLAILEAVAAEYGIDPATLTDATPEAPGGSTGSGQTTLLVIGIVILLLVDWIFLHGAITRFLLFSFFLRGGGRFGGGGGGFGGGGGGGGGGFSGGGGSSGGGGASGRW